MVLLAICAVSVAAAAGLRLSDPVERDEESATFGAPIRGLPTPVSLVEVLDEPGSFLGKTLFIATKVSKVCQKKGCFFIAQQSNRTIRVAFKDYDFFVPTDIAGRQVTLVGEIEKREITDVQAKHLSKDLSQPGSIKSGVQYQIIASSVKVFKPT